jgi:putative PIN family toxin of toxin-antitoxin system
MSIVVLYTNFLLYIFVFNDFRAIHLKEALIGNKVIALATPNTLGEFADVLSRPLFALDEAAQESILLQWGSIAKTVSDYSLKSSPWKCKDSDDQVFLDLAYSHKPCILISKDNEVLVFSSRAAKEQVHITADYTLAL